jgi:hypothetical protein
MARRFLFVTCFHIIFLLGIFFDSEDGGDLLLQNFGWHILEESTLHNHRRPNFRSYKISIVYNERNI